MMTSAEFLASDQASDRDANLAFLEKHLTAEEYAQYDNDAIPTCAIIAILKGKAEEIDTKIGKTKTLDEAKSAWDKKVKDVEWEDTDSLTDKATEVGNETKFGKVKGADGKKRWRLTIFNPLYCQIAVMAIEAEKKRVIDEVMEALNPKAKKSSGTKRPKKDESDYEIEYIGDKDKPQGHEYNHYLESDEYCDADADPVAKDQKIEKGKDGAKDKKKKRWRAVKKEKPFLMTDTCRAAISWDRAAGSDVLDEFGLKGSFRMCCAETKLDDGKLYCSKHLKAKDKKGDKFEDFFEGAYKTGDLKGVGWAQFLVDKCGECAVEEGVDEDWVKEMGGTWNDDA